MKKTIGLLVAIIALVQLHAQVRIDSSFAFASNPSKKYSLYIPSSYSASQANEMMVAFHPFNTSRWDAVSWCDTLTAFSEANDLILVCPDGDADGNITDSIDYAFTTDLIDSVKKWYNIDDSRIYSIGFSMGGKAVYEYGLNNAEIFGGFIPIGPAINGSSFVNSVIQNSGGRPFYLVHGANDLPNSRFFPMLTALNANCALVDSIFMAGVGHTIDFPNRNQILSDAYQWVDSVNLTPRSAGFSLQSPLNLSNLTIRGFHEYTQDFKWGKSPLQDSCGVLKYEVLFDVPGGNFGSPLLALASNNNGLDTALSLSNQVIDSIMRTFNVQIGGSLSLDWTVRSNILNKHSDTAKSFRISFIRQRLGFSLTGPANNNLVVLTNNAGKFFNWTDLNHYISVTYELLFADTSGDFDNPILSYLSTSNGTNSSLNQSHEKLYYDLMFRDGKEIGDTIHLKWKALAYDSVFSEFSADERLITFVRGVVGFKLFEPIDSAIITSKRDVDYVFKWDSVLLDSIHYELRFDTLGVDLTDSIVSRTYGSNSDSADARLDVTFELLDSLMEFYGVEYLDTLAGQWTVRALHSNGEEYSLTTYKVTIIRSRPVGIEEVNAKLLKAYPNPSDGRFVISGLQNDDGIVRVYSSVGELIMQRTFDNTDLIELNLSDQKAGTYLVRIAGGSIEKSIQIILQP